MKISITNRQSELALDDERIKVVVREVLRFEGSSCDEVSVVFVDSKEISRLHQRYFNDPSPTDCISFPIDSSKIAGYHLLGEVIVCPEAGIDYAKQHHKNPYDELTLYLIHGLLHLLGYDDTTGEDRQLMRKKEQNHLENLRQLGLCCHL